MVFLNKIRYRIQIPLLASLATYGTLALPSYVNKLEETLFHPLSHRREASVLAKQQNIGDIPDFSFSPTRQEPNLEENDNVDNDILNFPGEDYIELALDTDTDTSLCGLIQRISGPNQQQATQKVRHTGTTIAGCVAENGEFVVLAADSRATEESIVADKLCEKVHKLSENVWCCGAGTSADNDALVRQIRYVLMLDGMIHESIGNFKLVSQSPYQEKRCVAKVSAVCRRIRKLMYDARGNLGVNLVLGGFDFYSDRAILVAIHPFGSMDTVPFTALGSGGLAAIGILESGYNPEIKLDEAVELVKAAIAAGISNDLGSGSQIDLCIIGRHHARYHRAYVKEEDLPVTDFDKANAAELHVRHQSEEDDQRRGGVGGFGNLPFAVKTSRLVMKNDEAMDQSRREWLDLTLDL